MSLLVMRNRESPAEKMKSRNKRQVQMKINSSEYAVSAVREDQYPKDDLPEIALAGRSNVGKSSLINTLNGMAH